MTTKRSYDIIAPLRSHSLTDKTPVCGIGTPGSIPGESTNENSPVGLFSFVLSPSHLSPRKRCGNRSRTEVVWSPKDNKTIQGGY
jgi:hypothetical protein